MAVRTRFLLLYPTILDTTDAVLTPRSPTWRCRSRYVVAEVDHGNGDPSLCIASASVLSAAVEKGNEDLQPAIADIRAAGRNTPKTIVDSLNEKGITAARRRA